MNGEDGLHGSYFSAVKKQGNVVTEQERKIKVFIRDIDSWGVDNERVVFVLRPKEHITA